MLVGDEERHGYCQRAEWCSGRVIAVENGVRTLTPARTYADFCLACTDAIRAALADLPGDYVRLAAEIGELGGSGAGHGKPVFGPRLPLRGDVDALMREIAEVLLSWEERTRAVARRIPLDTQASRKGDTAQWVRRAAGMLGDSLSAMLALGPEPMVRSRHVSSGEPDEITIEDLAGKDAGKEILELLGRCSSRLGRSRRQPEIFEGVPCKVCDAMALERAEPPSDPAREAMWSVCAVCRAMMSKRDYDAWAKWYAAWADGLAPQCRRCFLDDHENCEYPRCPCTQGSHPRRRAA